MFHILILFPSFYFSFIGQNFVFLSHPVPGLVTFSTTSLWSKLLLVSPGLQVFFNAKTFGHPPTSPDFYRCFKNSKRGSSYPQIKSSRTQTGTLTQWFFCDVFTTRRSRPRSENLLTIGDEGERSLLERTLWERVLVWWYVPRTHRRSESSGSSRWSVMTRSSRSVHLLGRSYKKPVQICFLEWSTRVGCVS